MIVSSAPRTDAGPAQEEKVEQNACQGEKADIAADGIDEADHIFKTEDASHKSKGAQEGIKRLEISAPPVLCWTRVVMAKRLERAAVNIPAKRSTA